MNDEQLLRYSRQIFLPEIDIAGQLKIQNSHVLIIGLGGLGSVAGLMLAASGVGRMTLVDHDTVEISNLQRQIAYRETDIGQSKGEALKQALLARNRHIQASIISTETDCVFDRIESDQLSVVLDCTDNFKSRKAINQFCYKNKLPLVSGAAIRFAGQLAVFDFRQTPTPCYACLYPEVEDEQTNCSQNGVFAPVPNIVGGMQALEALKLILGLETLAGRLMIWDAITQIWRKLAITPDPLCPVCGTLSRTI